MAKGEDIMRDIISTFSMIIVEMSKCMEQKGTGFKRRQFANVLREAANREEVTSSGNSEMIMDILTNIATNVGGDETPSRRIQFSGRQR